MSKALSDALRRFYLGSASFALALALAALFSLCVCLGCSGLSDEYSGESYSSSEIGVEEDSAYYDAESVAVYYDSFGHLPPNYITKDEARDLGWEGGSVEKYEAGAAIGGDSFGNYEGLLPEGVSYIECDIDTHGASKRGAKRLIISSDGRYYYTQDHYESYREIKVEDGKAVWL